MTILFVEDNANTALAAKTMLGLRGYSVDTAGSVAAAQALLARKRYDLLVSDIRLPDGAGYELLPDFPRAIAISGFTTEADRSEAIAKGFGEYLTKPFKSEELIAAIERAGM